MLKSIGFAMIFGIAISYGSLAQSQKKIGDSANNGKTPQGDTRGTQKSPLVVDTHSIQTPEEAAQQNARDAEQKHTNRWLIGLTFAIAICAGFQVLGAAGQIFVYWKQKNIMNGTLEKIAIQANTMESQLGEMKRQADHMSNQTEILRDSVAAAKQSAKASERSVEAFINRERPLLTARPVFRYVTYLTYGQLGVATVLVSNVGASNAKNVVCKVSVVTTSNQEHGAPDTWKTFRIPPIIKPTGEDEEPHEIRIEFVYENDFRKFDLMNDKPDPKLFVVDIFGVITYEGISGSKGHDLWFRYGFHSDRVRVNAAHNDKSVLYWQPEGKFVKSGNAMDNRET